MNFIKNHEYTISLTERIDAAFKDKKLPTNSFIHKGKCGIGGTTLEMECPRHSLITAPTVQIIADKAKDTEHHPYGFFGVMGGTTESQIRTYLINTLNAGGYIKIMATPDSFHKIMDAAVDIEGFNIKEDCFLLLDECHSFVTEAFRKNIIRPFKWFWEFNNKSVISATPYYFTDKRFENFEHHKIKFLEPYINRVNIVKATSVAACLNHILTGIEYPGNVHIFYNSVTDTIAAIKRARLKEGNMFFADRSENHEKIEGFDNFYQDEPSEIRYKKFNFYTCKYYEGWDLFDDNATIIIVTDIHSPHTKIRISNKAVQAVGRLRRKPHQIYHITNHRNTDSMKTQEQISNDYKVNADKFIMVYNQMLGLGVEPIPEFKKSVEKFADVEDNKPAIYNSLKFDQMVNDQLCNEEYANIKTIAEQWKEGLYEPTHFKFEERLNKQQTSKENRKSKADKFRELVQTMERLREEKKDYAFNMADILIDDLKRNYPFEYEAYNTLGANEIAKLKYNYSAIKIALIEVSNLSAEMKLKKLLNQTFQVNMTYTKKEIKEILKQLYSIAGLKDKNGNTRIATAEQLGEPGRYDIHETKKKVNDKWEPAFKILRAQFELKIAA